MMNSPAVAGVLTQVPPDACQVPPDSSGTYKIWVGRGKARRGAARAKAANFRHGLFGKTAAAGKQPRAGKGLPGRAGGVSVILAYTFKQTASTPDTSGLFICANQVEGRQYHHSGPLAQLVDRQ